MPIALSAVILCSLDTTGRAATSGYVRNIAQTKNVYSLTNWYKREFFQSTFPPRIWKRLLTLVLLANLLSRKYAQRQGSQECLVMPSKTSQCHFAQQMCKCKLSKRWNPSCLKLTNSTKPSPPRCNKPKPCASPS